jgi:hypothetical protein
MKIYNRIRMNIDTWEILEEDSYEYSGQVSWAKGGSSGGDSVDKAYNKRMAKIAERQQGMAEEYFDFWREYQAPTEQMREESARQLLPAETELRSGQIASESRLLGVTEDYNRSMMEYAKEDLQARKPLAKKYYEEAMKGDNVNRAGQEAAAGVAQQHDIAAGARRREAARAGVDVNSARFNEGLNATYLSRARDIAGQSSLARQKAKDSNFGKMDTAMNKQIGVGV